MRYVFGAYELDTQLYELRHTGRLCQLEPQVFDVLAYLVQHRDRVISKDELLDRLWPEQFVSDAILHTRIMMARKAVGDSGHTQRVIKTMRGRGYRFVAPVQERVREGTVVLPLDAVSTLAAPLRKAEPRAASPPLTSPLSPTFETLPGDAGMGRCHQCSHVNPGSARFCNACGARLEAACPACDHVNPPESQFCGACGALLAQPVPSALALRFESPLSYTPLHLAEKILTAGSALIGERKQVTVLFCDIVNSSALAERLGAEAMHGLLNDFFELSLADIHRYEGTINQFLGDGFMALFGAPIAHEDHARRAVMAAMGIQRRLPELTARGPLAGVQVAVRMGLHSGQVVVGAIGDNLRMDYTAVGDTTNVTARLQQVATAGQIVISAATHCLVAGYCTTRSLGELSLKGKSAPIPAWEVQTIHPTRTRIEVADERGLTRFVGRERELRTLHDCFAQVRDGRGQVVFIVGEAAIGKSRLLLEFRRQLGSEAVWLEGHALSFGSTMAFHPLIDLLKRTFDIEEDDAESTIIEKLTRSAQHRGDNLLSTLPYLRYLLGVDPGDVAVRTMDPKLRRSELFDALRRLLLQATDDRPQVVVIEDLHWMDEATAAFLAFFADSMATSRVLCLLTHRPGYEHPFGDRTYHARLVLPALSPADAVQMARTLLGTDQLPAMLETFIVEKAEGNPFFVEEVVKSLQERGALRWDGPQIVLSEPLEAIAVPGTVQDVLMARIDRLPDNAKRTLQVASVIGRTFTRRVLDHLTDMPEQTENALQELKTAELIYDRYLLPEPAYIFKHALTQEVAYNSMLVRRQQEWHRRVGTTIEILYADRLPEHYEVLAHHFAHGQVWDKALTYLCKAAEKAVQAFAIRDALPLYDQALEAAGRLGDAVQSTTLIAIHQARATLYATLSDFTRARRENERGLALARQAGDRTSQAAALAGMGWASLWSHDFDRALSDTSQAIEIAEDVDAQQILVSAYIITGSVYGVTGRLAQAREDANTALTINRVVGDRVNQSRAELLLGVLKNWEGLFAEAITSLAESVRIAREIQFSDALLNALWVYGLALTARGNYDRALAIFEEGLPLSEKVGAEIFNHRLLNCLGWLYSELGGLDRAIDPNRRSAEGGRQRGDPEVTANAELNLADIFLVKGDLHLAQEFLNGVYRLAHDPTTSDWQKWRYSTHLFASLGELWLARGDPGKAVEFADQCLDIATRTTSRKYLVRGWRLRGEIAIARRQWGEAENWLQQALAMAQEIGNPTQLWKTYVALGQRHEAAKRPEQARQAYHAACEVIDRLKVSIQNPALRTSLEQSVPIRQVYDLRGTA